MLMGTPGQSQYTEEPYLAIPAWSLVGGVDVNVDVNADADADVDVDVDRYTWSESIHRRAILGHTCLAPIRRC